MELDFEISEKKLQEIVFNILNSNEGSVIHIDGIIECIYQQFNIDSYGVADIVVFTKPEYGYGCEIYVIELKKGIIDYKAIGQVYRYIKGIYKTIENNEDIGLEFVIKPILIGAYLQDELIYIPGVIEDLDIYTYDIDKNGIKFELNNNWEKTEFSPPEKINKILNNLDILYTDNECLYGSSL